MTDNTQELDDLLDIHDNLVLLRKAAGDDTHELRETTKQAIIDWHNKQVEEVLNELDSCRNTHNVDAGCDDEVLFIPYSALEAERNKLKAEAELSQSR